MLDALVEALAEAFGSEASVLDASHKLHGVDGMVEIKASGKTLQVLVEVKREVYPRDLRNAVYQLRRGMDETHHRHEAIGLLAAGVLSPGAKQELREQNIASFELGGSLYLKHDGWLINIEKPSHRPKKNTQGIDLFTEARESVIHALLMNSHGWLTGTELAEQAETSPYTCSLVLQELTLREWVESTGGGPSKRRMLARPGKLLDAWSEQWQERKEKKSKWYTFVENPRDMLSHLAERIDCQKVDYPWAFTGAAAANVYAPLLTSTEGAEIIVPRGYAERMADVLGLKPVSKGANVTLIEREPASLLYREMHPDHPIFFASPYILYLDLLDGRGRNKELAEHIRERLESLWQRD
ncbi:MULTISPECIES: type IV toxin-antitoxin system AbiEi family antitoxin [Enterobacterales]|uniref:type IV toxin-antitoxin system AbiEi family antitoxin n=1 Tax=Enterobacterales TaxID=91347 RepID=UPI001D032370|nr:MULTISPECIES: type IV toxin-antitoxin system AbiEi family antitoxin [Enterobacterales]